ncbi:hypothetical protein CDAR_472281 [Caerostris darwini]|uniref:Uncharacterized protein n=1 Tax=Caerostris darwini TaxID=1538125 RepID=A0AAV4VMN0_9ARAC|nr:hypothetical protein CDAR_472281 [Caerostris darwini]
MIRIAHRHPEKRIIQNRQCVPYRRGRPIHPGKLGRRGKRARRETTVRRLACGVLALSLAPWKPRHDIASLHPSPSKSSLSWTPPLIVPRERCSIFLPHLLPSLTGHRSPTTHFLVYLRLALTSCHPVIRMLPCPPYPGGIDWDVPASQSKFASGGIDEKFRGWRVVGKGGAKEWKEGMDFYFFLGNVDTNWLQR